MNIKKLPHIVIVGAGFGGMEVARRLTRELAGKRRPASPTVRERALLRQLPRAWERFAAAPRFWR